MDSEGRQTEATADEILTRAIAEGDNLQHIKAILNRAADIDKIVCRGQTPLAYLYQKSHHLNQDYIMNIRAIIENKKIAHVYSDVTFSYSMNDYDTPPRTTNITELFNEDSAWKQSRVAKRLHAWDYAEDLIWLHVGLTCGQFVFAVFREFIRMELGGHGKVLMEIIALSLKNSPISLNPSLNQREYCYITRSITRRTFGDLKTSYIVFPCLVLTTWEKMKEGKDKNQKAMQALDSLWGTSTRGRQSSVYNLQLEKTLDEAYHPSLNGSRAAEINKDQIVAWEFRKNARKNARKAEEERMPVLMVPQLWIWRAGHCVVTAYSMARPGLDNDPMYDRRLPLKMEIQMPDIQIGLILAHHIELFGEKMEPTDSDTFSPPLDVFENAVLLCLSDVDDYSNSPSNSADKFREKELIHSIADIRSELHMIGGIIQEQTKVLNKFLSDVERFPKEDESYFGRKEKEAKATYAMFLKRPANSGLGTEPLAEGSGSKYGPLPYSPPKAEMDAWFRILRAKFRLERYLDRIKKISNDAERIETSIQGKLELKRTNAGIKHAHNSLLLSMAVVGFTVITVIFAPLQFLTALFALDVEGFDKLKVTLPPDNDNEEAVKVYSSRKLVGIFVGSEFLTIAITVSAIWLSIWALRKWERKQDQAPYTETREASKEPKPPKANPKKTALRRGKEKSDASLEV
ncbi:MAG: hypothetical protein Q9171_007078 [Xanthocarpia ochracea]